MIRKSALVAAFAALLLAVASFAGAAEEPAIAELERRLAQATSPREQAVAARALGIALRRKDEDSRSLPYFEQAVAARRLVAHDAALGRALGELAAAYRSNRMRARQIAAAREAVTLLEPSPKGNERALAHAHVTLAEGLWLDDPETAFQSYQRALGLYATYPPSDPQRPLAIRMNYARLLSLRDRTAEAHAQARSVLDSVSPRPEPGVRLLAHRLFWRHYFRWSQHDEFERHRLAALRAAEELGDKSELAVELAAGASALAILGDERRSRELVLRARPIMDAKEVDADDLPTVLEGLATAVQISGDRREAERMADQAVAMIDAGRYPLPLVRNTLANAATASARAGNLEKASRLWRRALANLEDCPGCPVYLINQASVETRLGRGADAAKTQRTALALALAQRDLNQAAYAHRALSLSHIAAGQRDAAIFHGKQTLNALQQVRGRMTRTDASLQAGFLESRAPYYRLVASWLVDAGRIAEAQQALDMLKDVELSQFVRGEAAPAHAGSMPLWSAEARAQARMQDLAKDAAAFDAFMAALHQELVRAAPGRKKEDVLPERLARLQRDLGDMGTGVVAVHYVVTPDRLVAIVTTPSGQAARVIPIGEQAINEAAFALKRALQERSPDYLPAARRLYDLALRPLVPDLEKAQARVLMLSLDGALRYVPFAAMHDGKKFVAERYGLALLTAASRDNLSQRPRAAWSMAGLGVTRAHQGFPSLPWVKLELETIKGRVHPGEVHLDESFDRARLDDTLRRGFALVHIASHFSLAPGTDADSFLLLGDGSRLSLREMRLRKLDFRAADLVTLSACDTAVMGGRDDAGREVDGFGALVQNQGARSVLATLWKVADDSTARFMWTFYSERAANPAVSKAEALRRAQVKFIERGTGAEARLAHPFHWAPFVLMGNWL